MAGKQASADFWRHRLRWNNVERLSGPVQKRSPNGAVAEFTSSGKPDRGSLPGRRS
jgi:hypothetical protein